MNEAKSHAFRQEWRQLTAESKSLNYRAARWAHNLRAEYAPGESGDGAFHVWLGRAGAAAYPPDRPSPHRCTWSRRRSGARRSCVAPSRRRHDHRRPLYGRCRLAHRSISSRATSVWLRSDRSIARRISADSSGVTMYRSTMLAATPLRGLRPEPTRAPPRVARVTTLLQIRPRSARRSRDRSLLRSPLRPSGRGSRAPWRSPPRRRSPPQCNHTVGSHPRRDAPRS